MVAAYILIDISIDVDEPVALAAIRAVPGVQQAHLVVGPNDCIAYLEVDSQQQAMDVLKTIRAIKGVLRTDMRSAAEL
ncbi:MAG: AsnC family transcriptional regulator [Anaerolineaceae bacterium]|nr:AsnC family transcriptional regulator [Anaerolineaceae bacterium]